MFDLSSLLVLFAFGLVLTGVVYLGIVQAREEATQRRLAAEKDLERPTSSQLPT